MYNFPKKRGSVRNLSCVAPNAAIGVLSSKAIKLIAIFILLELYTQISAKIIQLHFSFVHQFSPMRFHILSLHILDSFRVSATRLVGTKKLFSCYVCHLFFVMWIPHNQKEALYRDVPHCGTSRYKASFFRSDSIS